MGNGDVNVLEELIKVLDFANFIRKYLLNKIYSDLIKCKLCLLINKVIWRNYSNKSEWKCNKPLFPIATGS